MPPMPKKLVPPLPFRPHAQGATVQAKGAAGLPPLPPAFRPGAGTSLQPKLAPAAGAGIIQRATWAARLAASRTPAQVAAADAAQQQANQQFAAQQLAQQQAAVPPRWPPPPPSCWRSARPGRRWATSTWRARRAIITPMAGVRAMASPRPRPCARGWARSGWTVKGMTAATSVSTWEPTRSATRPAGAMCSTGKTGTMAPRAGMPMCGIAVPRLWQGKARTGKRPGQGRPLCSDGQVFVGVARIARFDFCDDFF